MVTPRFAAGSGVTSSSPMKMRPPVGYSSPAIMRSAVVLPHPDGPSSVTSCPAGISRVTPSTATTVPKRLTNFSSRTGTGATFAARALAALRGASFPLGDGGCILGRGHLPHGPGDQPPFGQVPVDHVEGHDDYDHEEREQRGQRRAAPQAAVFDIGEDLRRGQVVLGRHQEDDLA